LFPHSSGVLSNKSRINEIAFMGKRCGSKSSSVELYHDESRSEVVKREAFEYEILFMASANLWKRAGVGMLRAYLVRFRVILFE
jgi:hypothetical protein